MELKPIGQNLEHAEEIYASEDCQLLLNIYKDYYPKAGFILPWIGYFVLRDGLVVGSCGFTGKPVNGKVEIAYWTFKKYERQGVASFSCKQLVQLSKNTDPKLIIIAKTEPKQNFSNKILQNNGFKFSGIVQDDDIGDSWQWSLV
jgi:RimJ/RimL family protein N-acetyltransferase